MSAETDKWYGNIAEEAILATLTTGLSQILGLSGREIYAVFQRLA